MKTILAIEVDYDPEITDPESLASAADTLLTTALSTPGILNDYGNPIFDEFFPPQTGDPTEGIVLAVRGDKILLAIRTEEYQGAEVPYPHGFKELLGGEAFDVVDAMLTSDYAERLFSLLI